MLSLLLNIDVFMNILMRNRLAAYFFRDTSGKEFTSLLPSGPMQFPRVGVAFNLGHFMDAAKSR